MRASRPNKGEMDQMHIPAWKRLGLKLRYAKERESAASPINGAHQSSQNNSTVMGLSTATMDDQPILAPAAKRRRLDDEPAKPIVTAANGLKKSSSFRGLGTISRKTVSFTPETKEDDGESSNFMQDKWDEEARNDQINDFLAREAEAAEAAVKTQTQPVSEESKSSINNKILKGSKKERRTSTVVSKAGNISHKSTDALDYLQQYQNSRQTWKFNKNREVWLLKHVLSTVDIPVTYEPALCAYLAGIKSNSSRARLTDQCHDCIIDEVESGSDESDRALISKSLKMDTSQRRLIYYQAGSRRFEDAYNAIASDEDSRKVKEEARARYERVHRAAKLLECLLVAVGQNNVEIDKNEGSCVGSNTTYASTTETPKNIPKKRKNRTAVVEVSSSSDESSSDDSRTDSNE